MGIKHITSLQAHSGIWISCYPRLSTVRGSLSHLHCCTTRGAILLSRPKRGHGYGHTTSNHVHNNLGIIRYLYRCILWMHLVYCNFLTIKISLSLEIRVMRVTYCISNISNAGLIHRVYSSSWDDSIHPMSLEALCFKSSNLHRSLANTPKRRDPKASLPWYDQQSDMRILKPQMHEKWWRYWFCF